MSSLAKVVVVVATVSACSARSISGPQPTSDFGGTETQLFAPTYLHATFVGTDGKVIISWTEGSANNVSGFLVERALDLAGPWGIHGFTRTSDIGDVLAPAQHYCYRVAALAISSSNLNSLVSAPLCIVRSAQGH